MGGGAGDEVAPPLGRAHGVTSTSPAHGDGRRDGGERGERRGPASAGRADRGDPPRAVVGDAPHDRGHHERRHPGRGGTGARRRRPHRCPGRPTSSSSSIAAQRVRPRPPTAIRAATPRPASPTAPLDVEHAVGARPAPSRSTGAGAARVRATKRSATRSRRGRRVARVAVISWAIPTDSSRRSTSTKPASASWPRNTSGSGM